MAANPPCAWACSMQGGVMMQGSDERSCMCSMYPAYHNLPPTCACTFRPVLWQGRSYAPKWVCLRNEETPKNQIPRPNVLMSKNRCDPYTPGLAFPSTLPTAPQGSTHLQRVNAKTYDQEYGPYGGPIGPAGRHYWSFVHTPGLR